ncbi:flagellar basal body-associated FliL family protein [Salipiger sp.]|uniref:flagellar basal body-associated FliL family protein n=1 Tax=Salipiger sp. TaxID=2078585 RepID=UPI003A96B5DC
MKKLLPILLALIGTGAGVGAGIFLGAPPPAEANAAADHGDTGGHDTAEASGEAGHGAAAATAAGSGEHDGTEAAFVKLNNQFIVPILDHDRVQSLVVLALSLEVPATSTEDVYAREPKLRDGFLRVLFDHANIGGFEGNFTESHRMDILRRALLESARRSLGDVVRNVLITEIARQDT